MTTGEIIFYSGLGLFGATALLAIIFWLIKPRYRPESVVYESGSQETRKLRNGYPTDPLTIHGDPPAKPTGPVTNPSKDEGNESYNGELDETSTPDKEISSPPQTAPVAGTGTIPLQEIVQGGEEASPTGISWDSPQDGTLPLVAPNEEASEGENVRGTAPLKAPGTSVLQEEKRDTNTVDLNEALSLGEISSGLNNDQNTVLL